MSDSAKPRPEEQPAVRTTIVGGRPPGSGKPVGPIPRGIEVLVKKAAVDAEFRRALLERRADAARDIGLRLEAAEAMMLAAIPSAQLEAIIDRTTVSPQLRPAFLGRAAAIMLAALGVTTTLAGCEEQGGTKGILPDRPDTASSATQTAETATNESAERPPLPVPVTGIQPVSPAETAQPRTDVIILGLTVERLDSASDQPATNHPATNESAAPASDESGKPVTVDPATIRKMRAVTIAGAVVELEGPVQAAPASDESAQPAKSDQPAQPVAPRVMVVAGVMAMPMTDETALKPAPTATNQPAKTDESGERPAQVQEMKGLQPTKPDQSAQRAQPQDVAGAMADRPDEPQVAAGVRDPNRPAEVQAVRGIRRAPTDDESPPAAVGKDIAALVWRIPDTIYSSKSPAELIAGSRRISVVRLDKVDWRTRGTDGWMPGSARFVCTDPIRTAWKDQVLHLAVYSPPEGGPALEAKNGIWGQLAFDKVPTWLVFVSEQGDVLALAPLEAADAAVVKDVKAAAEIAGIDDEAKQLAAVTDVLGRAAAGESFLFDYAAGRITQIKSAAPMIVAATLNTAAMNRESGPGARAYAFGQLGSYIASLPVTSSEPSDRRKAEAMLLGDAPQVQKDERRVMDAYVDAVAAALPHDSAGKPQASTLLLTNRSAINNAFGTMKDLYTKQAADLAAVEGELTAEQKSLAADAARRRDVATAVAQALSAGQSTPGTNVPPGPTRGVQPDRPTRAPSGTFGNTPDRPGNGGGPF